MRSSARRSRGPFTRQRTASTAASRAAGCMGIVVFGLLLVTYVLICGESVAPRAGSHVGTVPPQPPLRPTLGGAVSAVQWLTTSRRRPW